MSLLTSLPNSIIDSNEFKLIAYQYKGKTANRSGVPLINHIIEGCLILCSRRQTLETCKAFCLHPLFQSDNDLKENFGLYGYTFSAGMLALEYRNIANQYLSDRVISSIDEIKLSPLPEVNEMLVADKIQNYKDFLLYHKGTHPRSAELDAYFKNWLRKLEISDDQFQTYFDKLSLAGLDIG